MVVRAGRARIHSRDALCDDNWITRRSREEFGDSGQFVGSGGFSLLLRTSAAREFDPWRLWEQLSPRAAGKVLLMKFPEDLTPDFVRTRFLQSSAPDSRSWERSSVSWIETRA